MSSYKPPHARNTSNSTTTNSSGSGSEDHRTFTKTSQTSTSQPTYGSGAGRGRGSFGGRGRQNNNRRGGAKRYTNYGSTTKMSPEASAHYNRNMKISRYWYSQGFYDWGSDWEKYAQNSSLPMPPNYHKTENTDGSTRYLDNRNAEDYYNFLNKVKPNMYQGCKTTGGGCSSSEEIHVENRDKPIEQLVKEVQEARAKYKGTPYHHIYFKPRSTMIGN